MSDYTPTTEDVRSRYVYAADFTVSEEADAWNEFDRWLAAHDADVYQRGREDAATAVEAIHKPASYGYVYLEENSDAVDAVVCESCWDGEYRFDVYPCETLLAARGGKQ